MDTRHKRSRSAYGMAALAVGLVVLALLWRFTPLKEFADLGGALDWARRVAGTGATGPLAMVAVFVVASCLMFPITVLIAVTAIIMGPLLGFVTAMLGSVTAATVVFWFARKGGARWMERWGNGMVTRISQRLAAKGVLAVAVLRVVPVAPFTLINLVAGASHLRFKDFLLGTVIGLTPGILALSLLGSQVQRALSDPEPATIGIAVAYGILVVGLGWIGQKTIGDRMGKKDKGTKA